jgi:hypothetical protein
MRPVTPTKGYEIQFLDERERAIERIATREAFDARKRELEASDYRFLTVDLRRLQTRAGLISEAAWLGAPYRALAVRPDANPTIVERVARALDALRLHPGAVDVLRTFVWA